MGVVYTAQGDGKALVPKMIDKIRGDGGEISGGADSGDFSVKGFSGLYTLTDGKLTIEITKKPVFVPDSMIEAWLKANV